MQTLRDVPDLETQAVRLYAELGVGSLSRGGRGLLLLIDAGNDRVRLEVGRAMEGVLPDGFVAYVEQRQMVPFFERERVADGILATTELIVSRIQQARANAGYDNAGPIEGTGGGGASMRARLGAPSPARPEPAAPQVDAQGEPEDTVVAYLHSMDARNGRADLEIYTEATREMLAGWVMTPAQMDNLVSAYRGCHPEPARYDAGRRHAVIRYPARETACSPWFLTHEDGRWRLDLTMMQRAIRFGRGNAWHFVRGAAHPYGFAFEDWTLDRHGYPRAG